MFRLTGVRKTIWPAVASLTLGSGMLPAQPTEVLFEDDKLTAGDERAGDQFGTTVGLSGDTAVVGAFLDDHAGGMWAGSAYVFVRGGTTWSEQAKLTASDAEASDRFGRSVAVSGDTVVVGAFQDDHSGVEDAGSAYVFVRSGTTWSEQAKLTAGDAAELPFGPPLPPGDRFGYSLALSGDTAVVGAHHDSVGGDFYAGSAYVFVRGGTTWTEQAKLTASDV